jgi:hypothetical protein
MVTFKNNISNRRNNFRRSDRSFKNNGDRVKLNNGFTNNDNFQRKPVIRNINNISKLVEKYNNLAREALSSGDKILSENYFQHADHFTRILGEQEFIKKKIKTQTNMNSEQKIEKENNLKDSDQEKAILSQEEAINN